MIRLTRIPRSWRLLVTFCVIIFTFVWCVIQLHTDQVNSVTMDNTKINYFNSSAVYMDTSRHEKHNKELRISLKLFGIVNVHYWKKICPSSPTFLRHYPQFPLRPEKRELVYTDKRLRIALHGMDFSSQRVMGYFCPFCTGEYEYRLHSREASELWLSTSEDPATARRFLKNGQSNVAEQVRGHKYYFEILHTKEKHFSDKVEISFKLKVEKGRRQAMCFSLLTPFLSYEDDRKISSLTALDDPASHGILNKLEASPVAEFPTYKFKVKTTRMSNAVPTGSTNINDFLSLPFIDNAFLLASFGECIYEPVYLGKRDYNQYKGALFGIWSDIYAYVWPPDGSSDYIICYHDQIRCQGNQVIPVREVRHVIGLFMDALHTHARKYSLLDVVKIERKVNKLNKRNAEVEGYRYLFDLVIFEKKTEKRVRVSEYFYLQRNQTKLCRPSSFSWNPSTPIYVILTAKNQGTWVEHFIRDMRNIIKKSRAHNVHFIIADYSNNGLDIAAEFRRRGLHNFTIMTLEGKFHKTYAINQAVAQIHENNSIVFLFDLHLRSPVDLFEMVRKHTIKGRTTFTPILFRLDECASPVDGNSWHRGYWERRGYGIFSTYKSDWDAFGGMNETYSNKWGGEDWEMADRVLNHGLDFERVLVPGLYHFYHDKASMWDKAT